MGIWIGSKKNFACLLSFCPFLKERMFICLGDALCIYGLSLGLSHTLYT
jgi:hypothetical protein